MESGFIELEGFFSFTQHDVLDVGREESETNTDSEPDETGDEGNSQTEGGEEEGEDGGNTGGNSLGEDVEGGDLDGRVLLFEGSKSDGLELEEETEGQKEHDSSNTE